MSNYREILRLQRLGLNKTEIAASHGCARNTVSRSFNTMCNSFFHYIIISQHILSVNTFLKIFYHLEPLGEEFLDGLLEAYAAMSEGVANIIGSKEGGA